MTPTDLKTIVMDLFAKMGLDLKCEVAQDEAVYLLNISGSDARLLERAAVARSNALITIVRLIAEKNFGVVPKIILDFNSQRKQRLDNITQLARKKAELVRITGQEDEMPPMPPAERRAVHVGLREMPGIKTDSRGEEPHRRVVIIPDDES